MLPLAPTRLSTTMVWPAFSLSGDDIERAITSVEPPAAAFTTSRSGFAGHACAWAHASGANAEVNATAIRQRASARMTSPYATCRKL